MRGRGSSAAGGVVDIDAGPGIKVTEAAGVFVIEQQPEQLIRLWSYQHVNDTAASTATADRPFGAVPTGMAGTMTRITFASRIDQAGNDTNTFTIIVRRWRGGVAATVVTYQNTVASGGMSDNVPKDLGALANTDLQADDVLSYEVTKQGTGQGLGAGVLTVETTI